MWASAHGANNDRDLDPPLPALVPFWPTTDACRETRFAEGVLPRLHGTSFLIWFLFHCTSIPASVLGLGWQVYGIYGGVL